MKLPDYKRLQVEVIQKQVREHPELIHIIIGPRQSGKTTASLQIRQEWRGDSLFVSADSPLPQGPEWLTHHWRRARTLAKKPVLLIVDEVQKIEGWSETVKFLCDQDRIENHDLTVMLLGSSSLLINKGLTESLAGRFYLNRLNHWNYIEAHQAFGISLDQWLFFGGYPRALQYIDDQQFWGAYIRDSLIETVLAKDVLQMQNINKPTLLRHLFYLAASYPAQILSYNKMLGQLTDAGNTTTLSHYLTLLESAFLLSGLEQFKRGDNPKKGSSPKLIPWNNGLINAVTMVEYNATLAHPEQWGRLVENAVGAHFLNQLTGLPYTLHYWRKFGKEVDFVLSSPHTIAAVEVKSSRMKQAGGLSAFLEAYPSAKPVVIGGSGMDLESFFTSDTAELITLIEG